MATSRLPGFHRLDPAGRVERLVASGWLEVEERSFLESSAAGLERCSENVVGTLALPLGVATNIAVNGLDRLVPMAVEEPSVVAACSKAALMSRDCGGVSSSAGDRALSAYVLVEFDGDPALCAGFARESRAAIALEVARRHPRLNGAGGGLTDLVFREQSLPGHESGRHGLFELRCLVGDAMGANFLNDVAEQVGREAEAALPLRVAGAILSNVAPGEPARAEVLVPCRALATADMTGFEAASRIARLSDWALADRRRRVTQVKGILNGMEAMMTALYQDTRAMAAAVWEFAIEPRNSITRWVREGEDLRGTLEAPIVCGVVGGTGAVRPTTALFHRWMSVERAADLEEVAASVGLLQSLGALHALATTGIQKGHMKLHERKTRRG